MDSKSQHTRQVVEQFSRQVVHFAKLPGHEEATQLLIRMGGITATDEVLDVACGAGAVACAAARVARRVTGIDLTPAMKREDLQSVFSFKLRGAYNKMAGLPAHKRARDEAQAPAGPLLRASLR